MELLPGKGEGTCSTTAHSFLQGWFPLLSFISVADLGFFFFCKLSQFAALPAQSPSVE